MFDRIFHTCDIFGVMMSLQVFFFSVLSNSTHMEKAWSDEAAYMLVRRAAISFKRVQITDIEPLLEMRFSISVQTFFGAKSNASCRHP